jgi:hypothetical protein
MKGLANHIKSIVRFRIKGNHKPYKGPTWMSEDARNSVDQWIDEMVVQIKADNFFIPEYQVPQGMTSRFSVLPKRDYKVAFVPVDIK